jgi:hypothetical protein
VPDRRRYDLPEDRTEESLPIARATRAAIGADGTQIFAYLSGMTLALLITGAVVALGALIAFSVVGVRNTTRKNLERRRAELEVEGIVLDSGVRSMTVHFEGFRAPGLYVGVGVRQGPGQLVLTRKHLVFVGARRLPPTPWAELGRFKVQVHDGRLRLETDRPYGASGSLGVDVSVDDPEGWVRELRAAGATS